MKHFLTNRNGATAIEYALIASLIAIACVTAISALGGNNNGMWTRVQSNVSGSL